MDDVFISYSRKDKMFVEGLVSLLEAQGRSVWIDYQDIPFTAEWRNEILQGIRGANSFIAIISPDYVSSEVSHWEIEQAVSFNKRMVPVICRATPSKDVHQALRRYNFLPMVSEEDIGQSVRQILSVVDTDLKYIRVHTQLLMYANAWEEAGHDSNRTLRGNDLKMAEAWLAASKDKDPQPSDKHRTYIRASRRSATMRNTLQWVIVIYTIISAILGLLSFYGYRVATDNFATIEAQKATLRADANMIATQHQVVLDIGATATIRYESMSRELATLAAERDALLNQFATPTP